MNCDCATSTMLGLSEVKKESSPKIHSPSPLRIFTLAEEQKYYMVAYPIIPAVQEAEAGGS